MPDEVDPTAVIAAQQVMTPTTAVRKMEVNSVNPLDFVRQHAEEGKSVVAVAVSESTADPILQEKQVEVAELYVTVPMDIASKYTEGEVVVAAAAAAAAAGSDAAAVALPEPSLGPSHFDLQLGERLQLSGWSSYSVVATVEEVAAEDCKYQELEAYHLKPNQHGHRLLQKLHYLCLLPPDQRVQAPQMIQHYLSNDYMSVDQRFERKLHPHVTKEVDVNAGGGPSFSVSKIPS